ncbi:sulfite exporter TauE/SafE family protein [Marinomonas sp. M1K-6]|uniref:Probable membrane transporter protein n=1 Tax=Marinomonas profundi TaxID=2726122 RepID=A0A847QZL9_9GAMM|nr:sulfite exporter TauE/SafE family protein [Marinomonas profundi]NLQ16385.1 sulfite exporter TauE/SafE family protein [Marinomonas profundi]UDV03041.1 sulfite exporter TauE/SafE family protein [Marinomonas profundi]
MLLIFMGAATGAISSMIYVAPALIAIPALYFFLPVFDLSFQALMLPAVATCIVAFIPAHLYTWVKAMQQGEVDSQSLINFAPGIAMGGVIGAQLLSLINMVVFNLAFSFIAAVAVIHILFQAKIESRRAIAIPKLAHLPVGLLVGTLSLLSANCGSVLAKGLCTLNKTKAGQRQGTVDGLVVFASIAAMVGFIYPAKNVDNMGLGGFAGAVHLPSACILAASHLFFYWLCRQRGNALDKRVLSISFVVYAVLSLLRLWIP